MILLQQRKENGEKVDVVISNKEERKKIYEDTMIKLEKEIMQEQKLTMSMPRFMGLIKVIPEMSAGKGMQSDTEIEKIGMQVAIAYEKRNNRNPEDVSLQNLGFEYAEEINKICKKHQYYKLVNTK